jgi:hypothetical protein
VLWWGVSLQDARFKPGHALLEIEEVGGDPAPFAHGMRLSQAPFAQGVSQPTNTRAPFETDSGNSTRCG